jgi:hypothetical protein
MLLVVQSVGSPSENPTGEALKSIIDCNDFGNTYQLFDINQSKTKQHLNLASGNLDIG